MAERGEAILAVPTREGFNLSALLLRRRRRFGETPLASEEVSEAERSYLERSEREVRDLQVGDATRMPTIIVLSILLAAALYIVPPLLRGVSRTGVSWRLLADAASRRDTAYEALADLEFDYLSGKVSQDDFARLKRQYQKIAMDALKELESLSQAEAALGAGAEEQGVA